ncbi:SRPBCC family protein [Jejuia pallidilutea]|uniref:Uncharacterized conserved protein n=1 Tax=Jejuia pallidilutea TaxID=504487 RepID=A0A090W5R4_9FLAO|nr:SRPBCC family protein [Jejuia pallidilutea]GAL68669.1 uncharacterized conserved protein [Jejuia pallidilutea]GAL72286.1 uncharacterized conserved protein [Jejuia pallidilutea]GAL89253.1 uncharacterized conserved protein [Jejuia pallidilutea]
MTLVEVHTEINADLQTCFDLARDVDFYQNSLEKPNEIPITGKISGLVEKGDYVTWETNHLILTQHLTLKVTEFVNPVLFVDEMVKGDFKYYRHEHIFKGNANKTLMTDRFYFEPPYGIIGKLFNKIFLEEYMRKLLIARNKALKIKAEDIAERKKKTLEVSIKPGEIIQL